MRKFVIVIETDIHNSNEVAKLRVVLDGQPGLRTWTIDLEDDQKILRIVSTVDISRKVTMDLRRTGIKAAIMDIF